MPKNKASAGILSLVLCVLLGAVLCALCLFLDSLKMALLWLPSRLYSAICQHLDD